MQQMAAFSPIAAIGQLDNLALYKNNIHFDHLVDKLGSLAMTPARNNDIRRALLRLFSRLLDVAESDILPGTNLRQRFSGQAWTALADRINRLPEIESQGLTITPGAMKPLLSITDIERALHGKEVERAAKPPPNHAETPPPDKAVLSTIRPSLNLALRDLTPQAVPTAEVRQPQDQAEYQVWYGTSRRPNDAGDSSKGYSGKRDSKIHYGSCTVYIPKSHKIGSLGSSWWKRLLTLTDDRLKLLRIQETDEDAFWRAVAARLEAAALDDRDAVIFIHGYNVTFEDAALRAAQIGFDLSIKGAMAFFSWPSQGTLAGYAADEATIEANEDMIAEFMSKFAAQSHAKAVHIIAHSMGNRGVLRAVNRIAQKAAVDSGVPFGQIILAAADVDADTFRNLCAAYTRLSQRTTLYVSQRDLAVESSQWLHDFPRVGLLPPIFVTPGIDTVNVTNADLTALGHGYVASARDVLQDMHDLIVHGAPPNKRFGLKELQSDTGETYWSIGQ